MRESSFSVAKTCIFKMVFVTEHNAMPTTKRKIHLLNAVSLIDGM